MVGERSQSTRTTVDTRDTDGDNRDENDDIHETVETDQATILRCNDEGRGVGATAAKKSLIVGADEQTNKSETKNVEAVNGVSGCSLAFDNKRKLTG